MAFAIYARNPFLDSLWQEKIHDYQKPAATPGGACAICAKRLRGGVLRGGGGYQAKQCHYGSDEIG
jgi:hypothetical protein